MNRLLFAICLIAAAWCKSAETRSHSEILRQVVEIFTVLRFFEFFELMRLILVIVCFVYFFKDLF